jgi:hypothetical protein
MGTTNVSSIQKRLRIVNWSLTSLQQLKAKNRWPGDQARAVQCRLSFETFWLHIKGCIFGERQDFDLQLTLMASSLYRLMARHIGREYIHAQAKTIFRNLLDLSGKSPLRPSC